MPERVQVLNELEQLNKTTRVLSDRLVFARKLIRYLAIGGCMLLAVLIVVVGLIIRSVGEDNRIDERIKIAQQHIDQNSLAISLNTWRLCTQLAANISKQNQTNEGLVKFLHTFPQTPGLTGFTKFFEDAKLAVPDCGPKPK